MKRKHIFLGTAILVLIIIICIIIWKVSPQKTSAQRLPDKYQELIEKDGNKKAIEVYTSAVDKDNDGKDDQTDILLEALAYINTKPKYKSKYYHTGYPDDGYGVCTDVVAFALKGAGYDLKQLLQEDISANGEDYEIEEPDENIDFRRVKNLKVYFEHTAISLTTEVSAIEEWQGGDIVIFKKHIGIESDRRNKNGIPYIIHHNNKMQSSYEQDILEKRKDIVGHYRIS